METGKHILRKTIIMLLAAIAVLCLFSLPSIFGRPSARAEGRALSTCDGTHSGYTGITSTDTELLTGNYYLTQNIKLVNNLSIAAGETVTICLNGYILCGNGDGNVITVNSGATLTVCDCYRGSLEDRKHYYTGSKPFKFTDNNNDFLTSGSSSSYIEGGVIAGGHPAESNDLGGGGVSIIGGTLNLTGGAIAGNEIQGNGGGGVNIRSAGKFNMTGGSISGNSSPNNPGGGVAVDENCTFTMSGGKIWKNFANQGGGVDVGGTDAVFEMTGGEISENSVSAQFGGGVIVGKYGTFKLYGGTITKNKGEHGCGVHVVIINNIDRGTMHIGGNPKVFNNQNDNIRADGNMPFMTVSKKITDGAEFRFTRNSSPGDSNLLKPVTTGYKSIMGDDAEKFSECFFLDGDKPYYHVSITRDGEIAFTKTWSLTLNLYKGDDGNYVTDTENTTYDYSVNETVLPTPSRTCHTFGGWYANKNLTGLASTKLVAKTYGDKVFYAKWTENHSFGDFSVTQEATCTTAGKQQRTCTVCGKVEEKDIPAGHTVVTVPKKDPTCTDAGYTESSYCSVCNAVITAQNPIAVLGHSYGEMQDEVAASCTQNGIKAHKDCSVCNKHFDGDNTEITDLTIAALGHRYGEMQDEVAAACTQNGIKAHKDCSVCNKHFDGDNNEITDLSIPALGHSWGEWVAEDDKEVRTCSVCGATETRDKEPADIPVQPENPENPDNPKNPENPDNPEQPEKPEKKSSLLWLIISLAVVLAAECVVLALRLRAKKKKGDTKMNALLPLFAVVYPTGEIVAVAVLGAAVVGVGVAIACTFIKKKEPEAETADNSVEKSERPEPIREEEHTAVVAADEEADLPKAVSEEVRREIERLEEVKKDNVTAEEAKTLVSDAAANALITGRRVRKTGKKFAVNIDTLSEHYKANDTVDAESLKSKGIVPKSVKQIKILARGMLDKPLCVIADDFSADAVKMIVLTGGEARLQD